MDPHLADWLILAAAALVPVPLVWRFQWRGVALGVLWVWFALYAAGAVLNHLDPQRDAAILDSMWLLFGWMGGLIYATALQLGAMLVRRLIHRAR